MIFKNVLRKQGLALPCKALLSFSLFLHSSFVLSGFQVAPSWTTGSTDRCFTALSGQPEASGLGLGPEPRLQVQDSGVIKNLKQVIQNLHG